jgi:hypothetical protein
LFLSMISEPPPTTSGMGRHSRMAMLFALLASGLPLHAQSWDEPRGLKPGDRVIVQDTTGHDRKGAFRAVSADAITLETDKSEVAIERSKIRRVQVRSNQRRVRNAVIGAAIGVAIGVTVDQTLGAYLRNESNGSGRAAMYAAPIGLLGGLGAALPAYRKVYRVR